MQPNNCPNDCLHHSYRSFALNGYGETEGASQYLVEPVFKLRKATSMNDGIVISLQTKLNNQKF